MQSLDITKIPRERWAGALAMLLGSNPELVLAILQGGEDEFVKNGRKTDVYGITESEYRDIYRKLAKKAKRWGVDPRVTKH